MGTGHIICLAQFELRFYMEPLTVETDLGLDLGINYTSSVGCVASGKSSGSEDYSSPPSTS